MVARKICCIVDFGCEMLVARGEAIPWHGGEASSSGTTSSAFLSGFHCLWGARLIVSSVQQRHGYFLASCSWGRVKNI